MKRERLESKRRITRDLSYEDGEQLVWSIHGIDRALHALAGIDVPDIDVEPRRQRNEDASELLALLQGSYSFFNTQNR